MRLYRLNKWLVSICISVIVLLAQVIITQYSIISSLRNELRLSNAGSRLASDQIADMMYELSKLRSAVDTAATQNFVSGVTAAMTQPSEYEAIWHAGYDRGVSVQQYVDALDTDDKTTNYTNEKK